MADTLFIDSGAFSVFNRGATIEIQDYIDWIKENNFHPYANLDVIGDWKGSLANQEAMEAQDLEPIPCYHNGEPLELLERYVAEYEYIALGGMQSISVNKNARAEWLDVCFRIICDEDGNPRTKVHGFGMTSFSLMKRYPWYSVDSSSALVYTINGYLCLPKGMRLGKEADFENPPIVIGISSQKSTKKELGKHYNSLSEMEQVVVKEYINSLGFSLEEVQEEHGTCCPRYVINALFMAKFSQTIPAWPRKWENRKSMRARKGLLV